MSEERRDDANTGNTGTTENNTGSKADPNPNDPKEKRGRNRNNRHGKNNKQKTNPASSTFKGNEEKMNGNVFQTFSECNDATQLQRTMDALGEYINKYLKHASDLKDLVKSLTIPEIEEPTVDVKNPALRAEMIKIAAKDYYERKNLLKDNLTHIYTVVWGQCSEAMQTKIMGIDGYEKHHEASDSALLLQSIRQIKVRFDSNKSRALSLCEARLQLEAIRQSTRENSMEFFRRFKSLVDAYEHFGGTLGDKGLVESLEDRSDEEHPGEVPVIDLDELRNQQDVAKCIKCIEMLIDYYTKEKKYQKDLQGAVRGQTLAMMYLQRVDRNRYGDLWADLHNLYSRGDDQYPVDLGQAYSIVSNYVQETVGSRRNGKGKGKGKGADNTPTEETAVAFLQRDEELVPGTDGMIFENLDCYKCKHPGHYANTCPKQENSNKTGARGTREVVKTSQTKQSKTKGRQLMQVAATPETSTDVDDSPLHGLYPFRLDIRTED